MTEDGVKRFFVRNRFLKVEVEPGYELLGEYLCADLGPLDDREYIEARAAVRKGLKGESASHNGEDFFLQVDGENSTIILMPTDASLTLPTTVLNGALDQYEKFRRDFLPSDASPSEPK